MKMVEEKNIMVAALVSHKFLQNSLKFNFTFSKIGLKWLRIYKELKLETFLTLKPSQYGKSGSTFSSSVPVAASSELETASESPGGSSCQRLQQTRKRPVFRSAQAVPERCPKSLAIEIVS